MTSPREFSEAVVALLYIVIFALLLRAGLHLWVDCGRPCGASKKPQSQQQPRGAR